jgi:antitoxin (DNA-binding transcriptional repressor) of toxin-antitoxin stability system
MIRMPERDLETRISEAFSRVAKSGEPIMVHRDGEDLVAIVPARNFAKPESASRESHGKSVLEEVIELGESVPPEAWADVPEDLSVNLDHYLYGSPKVDE